MPRSHRPRGTAAILLLPSFKLPRNEFLTAVSHTQFDEQTKTRVISEYDRVAALRAEQTNASRSRKQKAHAWAVLVTPLTYELNNVRSGIRYFERFHPDAPVLPVMRTYFAAIKALYEFFVEERSNWRPLSKARADFEQQIGRPLPNNGEHWTDWIAPATKRRIEAAYNAVPYKPKAKRRHLFSRTLPPAMRQDDTAHGEESSPPTSQ